MKRSLLAVAAASLFAVSTARAQSPADLDAAKHLYDAGAQAYASGQFTVAIQAFEQANKLASRPAILFSLAQAQRRQYFLDKNPATLRAAIRNYRAYVEQVPEGGRRVDAAQALSELELIDARIGDVGTTKAPTKEPARLLIMSRPGAMVSVDDNEPKPAPLGVEVAAGKHRIRVTAPGYFPEEREALATDNIVAPVDVPLRARPGTLVVNAPRGADVSVDGRFLGTVSDRNAFDVPAGVRYVAVERAGHDPFVQEVELGLGEQRAIDAPLSITKQRVFSYGFLGLAGAAALTSGATAVIALQHENHAKDIDQQRQTSTITPADVSQYDRQVRMRDDFVKAAFVAGGVAVAAGALGAALFVFDHPSVPAAPSRHEKKPDAAPSPSLVDPTEIGIGPSASGIGAALHGRF